MWDTTAWRRGAVADAPEPTVCGVLVLAEDRLLRDCLWAALDTQSGLAVRGRSGALTRWPAGVRHRDVQVVVADLGASLRSAPVVARVVREATRGHRLVALVDIDADVVSRVAHLELDGLVARRSPLETLVDAIRRVEDGGVFLDPALVPRRAAAGGDPGPLATLTVAERRVMALLQHGLTNTQIAERLDRSVNTVKSQVSSALRKLRVSSRVEAAVVCERAGLAPAEVATAES